MRDKARQAIEELQIGPKLKYYRTQVRHWTLQELAEKIGYSKPLLSQVENNLVTPPLQTLYILCKALDVPVTDILEGLDDKQEMDSRATGEAAIRQMEVSLAQLKTAFKDLKPPKKAKAKASKSRRKPTTKARKRK